MITLWLFATLCCAYFYYKKHRNFINLPHVYPGALPIIGHTHLLVGDTTHLWDLLQLITKYSNENSGVALLLIGGEKYYFVTDPTDFSTVSNSCLQKHYAYDYMKPWVGDGLISGNDLNVWRRHKKLLQPAFSQQVTDGFLPIFNHQSRKLVHDFSTELGHGLFHHSNYIEQRGMEAICETSFAVRECTEFNGRVYSEKVGVILSTVTERCQKLWIQNEFMFSLLGYKKRQDEAINYINSVYDVVLKNKKLDIENELIKDMKPKTFIDIILKLGEDGKITDKEIWEEMNTIIAAGYETVSSSLVFTLILLGSYPIIQEKLWKELKEVFGDSTRDVEKTDLVKLVYLEAVIKEAARFITVTPALLRHVDKDVKLSNVTLSAGSHCVLLVSGLHRHPIWGDDVNEFKPERWLDPEAMADPNSALNTAFGVFGSGKRFCMGKSYAMMLMKTILAHVLRHYRVSSDVTKLKLRIAGLLKPQSGHMISVERRNGVFHEIK